MEKELLIAIVSENSTTAHSLKSKLETVKGFDIKVEVVDYTLDVETVIRLNPTITIIQFSQKPDKLIEIASKLNDETNQSSILIASEKFDTELILRFVQAGAIDFIKLPCESIELTPYIERALKKTSQRSISTSAGKVITIFSNKGGAGTTTVAVNLAVGLARFTKSQVVMVDLVSGHGDVPMFLDLNPSYTIIDLVENLGRADKTYLLSALARHTSGLYVLAEPNRPEDIEAITSEQIMEIINLLKSVFDYVIIDGGNEFNDQVLTALEHSDSILLVTLLNLPAIRNTKRCLDIFRQLRYDQKKARLIVNRYNSFDHKAKITVGSLEETLGYSVSWRIPNDYPLIINSINKGMPIYSINNDSELSKSFKGLVKFVSNQNSICEPTPILKPSLLKDIISRFIFIWRTKYATA